MDHEIWAETEYEGYSVSNMGRVQRVGNSPLRIAQNQRGYCFVTLYTDEGRFQVQVHRLVAAYFLEEPPSEHFNSLIHRDGNLENNWAGNLLWRPRWFVVNYRKQFRSREIESYILSERVLVQETGEIFDNIHDAAIAYGLLAKDIQEAMYKFEGSVRFAREVTFVPY